MQIITEPDFSGVDKNHRWAEQFQILNYSQGGYSMIPHGFFSQLARPNRKYKRQILYWQMLRFWRGFDGEI